MPSPVSPLLSARCPAACPPLRPSLLAWSGYPFINNSEFRILLGYERESAKEFTASVQYYLEYMMHYGNYRDTRPFFMPAKDHDRHVVTLRLTKLLINQNLILSLFAYMSPLGFGCLSTPEQHL